MWYISGHKSPSDSQLHIVYLRRILNFLSSRGRLHRSYRERPPTPPLSSLTTVTICDQHTLVCRLIAAWIYIQVHLNPPEATDPVPSQTQHSFPHGQSPTTPLLIETVSAHLAISFSRTLQRRKTNEQRRSQSLGCPGPPTHLPSPIDRSLLGQSN